MVAKRGALAGMLLSLSQLGLAEEWEAIAQQSLASEYSQTRQDGLKRVDTSTVKGLRYLWKVLAQRDPYRIDWYVREGAHEAIANAKGEDSEKEIDRVMGVGRVAAPGATKVASKESSSGAEDELAREAIVYALIDKIWEGIVKKYGGNEDRQIAEMRYQVRKARGTAYFEMVLPVVKEIDPDKRQLRRFQAAFLDKSPRVRRAGIVGLTMYPDKSSVPLLLDAFKKLEKQKAKNYREWVLLRGALETLTGQYFRDSVADWLRWWEVVKDTYSLEKRVEEEKEQKEGGGTTVVVKRDGIEVTVNMKIVGRPDGYPLLVLPFEGMEVDYFRPYFSGIEDICRVFYLRMPQIGDFKGLSRDASSNTLNYPTGILLKAMIEIMDGQSLKEFAVLAHGPEASTLGMMFAADNLSKVTHLILINPRSAGEAYRGALDNVRREGMRLSNKEIVKGVDNLLIKEDGNPTYKPADDAEAGGISRAIGNLAWTDPTEPEVGMMATLYRIPGGARRMADTSWSVKKMFKDKDPQFPVLIITGEKAFWTPANDQQVVATSFKRAQVVKMADSAEYPFISETHAFTRHIDAFLKPAIQALKAKEAKAKEKEKKDADKAEKADKAKEKKT